MQFQSSDYAKMLAKVDGSGAKDLSIDPSTFGFPQDANQEYYNRALQYGYSVSRQGFQDKGFLPGGPNFVLDNASAALGEHQQFDHFFTPLQPVESDGVQVQNNNINIKHCSRPSNASCIDHVEEITYGADGYDNRAISFGSSCNTGILCYPYNSPLQSDNCIADKQDGTWAALVQMQEALEAPNEECSDLTFNNTEISGGNAMQHQVVWDNGCLASPSFTSNYLPFPGEVEATVTNTSAICNLQHSDLQYDNDEGISSFELSVPEYNGATTSHVAERRDEMHPADLRTNHIHDEAFDFMRVTQDRENNISHEQFSSFAKGVDGSVGSGMDKLHGLYDCEEQMEIDSLLNSFGASTDTFPQTYEIFQKGENLVDLDKKVILEDSIPATFVSTTTSYTTQAGASKSAVSDGSSCQQRQSTSQSCGLFYSSASSQWNRMPSSVLPLGGCQNSVSESNPMTSLGTNGKELGLYSGHTSVHQQHNVSSGTKLKLIDNVANPYEGFAMGMDGQFCSQRVNMYHDEALATQGIWAAHRDMLVHSSAHTGHSDIQLPMTQTIVHLPSPDFSMDPNSSFVGAELRKVDQHRSDIQLHLAQTNHVQLPATRLSEDPNSSFIGRTELREVDQHDSDMQLPMAETTYVQLPATSLSKDPNSLTSGQTELKKVEQPDSDMQLPMTQTSDVQLPAMSLSKDPSSSLIRQTELKKFEQHYSDMQLPMTQTNDVQLLAMSSSKDPSSPLIRQTELKNVEQHDLVMQLPMTRTSDVQLPAASLSKDLNSSLIRQPELKKVEQHDSDMLLLMTHTCVVQLPATSLSKDPKSSLIERTGIKKVEQHDSDMQLSMTQTSHAQLPAPSLSKNPYSAFLGGTELKKVDPLDDYSHIVSPQQSIPLSGSKPSHSSGSPINKFDGEVGLRPIKRRRATANVVASEAQIMPEDGTMQRLRTPELDCAHATERLPEKVDGENATAEDSTFVSQAQRRLALTTSLMQHVLPVQPARLLAANVTNAGETAVYHISKVAVSDMYHPVLPSAGDNDNVTQSEYTPRSETSTSGKEDYDILSEVLESFDTKFGKLERSLSRVEKAQTFQDFAAEVRDIERWSILHRFVNLRMFQEYRRLHASAGLDSTPHRFSVSILKRPGDPSAPLDSLDMVQCCLLK
uniref:Uncharacterized protein n=1 Tax=Avena sativa TaxID=4498 RepID=A0ACD5WAH6_AVESA